MARFFVETMPDLLAPPTLLITDALAHDFAERLARHVLGKVLGLAGRQKDATA